MESFNTSRDKVKWGGLSQQKIIMMRFDESIEWLIILIIDNWQLITLIGWLMHTISEKKFHAFYPMRLENKSSSRAFQLVWYFFVTDIKYQEQQKKNLLHINSLVENSYLISVDALCYGLQRGSILTIVKASKRLILLNIYHYSHLPHLNLYVLLFQNKSIWTKIPTTTPPFWPFHVTCENLVPWPEI